MQSNVDNEEKANYGVNIIDSDGKSPLHRAAEEGHETVVKTLLAENADVNLVDKSNNTALSLAILNGLYILFFNLIRRSYEFQRKYEHLFTLRTPKRCKNPSKAFKQSKCEIW